MVDSIICSICGRPRTTTDSLLQCPHCDKACPKNSGCKICRKNAQGSINLALGDEKMRTDDQAYRIFEVYLEEAVTAFAEGLTYLDLLPAEWRARWTEKINETLQEMELMR